MEITKAEYLRQWRLKNPGKQAAYSKAWREAHPDVSKERQRRDYHTKREVRMVASRKSRFNQKNLCLQVYGPKCVCCGEGRLLFLTIDHIDGAGNDHKRKRGGNIYGWLIKNGYPQGFQVLCAGCNVLKGYFGVCPHKDHDTLLARYASGLPLVSRKRLEWKDPSELAVEIS